MSRPSDRLPVQGANQILPALWARGLAPPPITTPEQLMTEAADKTGLDDFGDETFREGLSVLCEAQRAEAELTPLGEVVTHGGLVRALSQRLTAVEWWKRHPEILDYPIVRPIIVLGGMRSGTTRLQRLLATDPRLQATRFFEGNTPAPPLSMRPGDFDRRRLTAQAACVATDILSPAFRKIHPTSPMAADEELPMLELSLSGAQIEAQRRVPSFRAWAERTSQHHAYRFLKPLLQLQGWLRQSDPARPWVLKTPQYMQDLDALLDVFPDARIVAIHREPGAQVASSASLVWTLIGALSDTVTKDWCGQEWLHKTAYRERTAAAVRAANPQVPAIDVSFADMNRNALLVMRQVYAFIGLTWSADVEARMQAWLSASKRRGEHRGHRYSLEEFGLAEADITRAFASAPAVPVPALS
ncbi:MAG: sulfotransferase [Pacificimonas sp.]|nr:sulfotransferase [Pacificimonas sp.]